MAHAGTSAICAAIRARVLLEFEYEGLRRVVAPYCHGETRSGEALRAIQVAGESRSRGFGFGKLWIVERMRGLQATSQSFAPDDPSYNPNDNAMISIHCRI
ncbi:MAG TPA: hypothetical protein VHV51_02055 [Polyangiaceae bacterium]|jgi:hypothetical protein|nr:hypothetical protein [Polyangiaceae bacterium]